MNVKAIALAAALALPAASAFAGPAEIELLARYEGDWRGSGQVTGPDPGTVVCRLTFNAPAADSRTSYSGRCSFGGQGAASFRGTIAYDETKRAFIAATSAQGVSGQTTGRRVGSSIVFATAKTETDYGTASSVLTLGRSSIELKFLLVDKEGRPSASSVSFDKR